MTRIIPQSKLILLYKPVGSIKICLMDNLEFYHNLQLVLPESDRKFLNWATCIKTEYRWRFIQCVKHGLCVSDILQVIKWHEKSNGGLSFDDFVWTYIKPHKELYMLNINPNP